MLSSARISSWWRRPQSRHALPCHYGVAFLVLFTSSTLLACPFCNVIEPTLVQRREAADVVALGELRERGENELRFYLHLVSQGREQLAEIERATVRSDIAAEPGALFVLLGERSSADAFKWDLVPVNEASYAYFARAPSLRKPAAERLQYFARYLEHPDELIAGDAYAEFGYAPYEDVLAVREALPLAQVRDWLVDPAVPPARKGFYGLLLGMADDADQRLANLALLKKLIDAPADDFREGFDGVLAGYLLAGGSQALQHVSQKYLANSDAADGDVRHVMSALRFYHTYGKGIPQQQLRAALRQLLARPEFAAATIIDLARWQDWQVLEQIANLYAADGYPQPAVGRAVVNYLSACDSPAAQQQLAQLRRQDPDGVAEAQALLQLSGATQ